MIRELVAQGDSEIAEELAALKARVGSSCPTHGELSDPIIATLEGERVVFCCPACSGSAVRARWEEEGKAQS